MLVRSMQQYGVQDGYLKILMNPKQKRRPTKATPHNKEDNFLSIYLKLLWFTSINFFNNDLRDIIIVYKTIIYSVQPNYSLQ